MQPSSERERVGNVPNGAAFRMADRLLGIPSGVLESTASFVSFSNKRTLCDPERYLLAPISMLSGKLKVGIGVGFKID
jgi:hypothetical protein